MDYSEKLLDHFNNPRNMGSLDKDDPNVGTGVVGSPECGDVMKLQVRVDGGIIADAKFKTFGCGAAIASSSLATEWLRGRTVAQAEQLRNTQLVEELALPAVKIHCSVLAEGAVKAALADWKHKHGRASTEPAQPGVESCEVCPTHETCGPAKAVEAVQVKTSGAAAGGDPVRVRLADLCAQADRLLAEVDKALGEGAAAGEHERKMLNMATAMLRVSLGRDDPDQIHLAIDMVEEALAPLAAGRRPSASGEDRHRQ